MVKIIVDLTLEQMAVVSFIKSKFGLVSKEHAIQLIINKIYIDHNKIRVERFENG